MSARVATGERDANGVRGESESCAGADGAPGSISQRPRKVQRIAAAPNECYFMNTIINTFRIIVTSCIIIITTRSN